jgi:hypothetical protein
MARKWEEYGWLIFVALGLLWLVTGLSQLFNADVMINIDVQNVKGMSWSELEALNPESSELVRLYMGTMGNLKTSWSLLVLAITLTGYRRGEKWAWYTLWLAPAILVCQGIVDSILLGDINEMLKWIPITSISLVGLLLPYRKFFPKQPRSKGNIT